MTKPCSSFK